MQELNTSTVLNTMRDDVFDAIEKRDAVFLKTIINQLHPGELADLLESMPPKARSFFWENVPSELDADILAEVQDEVRATLITDMNHAEIISAAATMEVDDLAEVIEDLPGDMRSAVEDSLSESIREKLETNLSFEENTAGRLMSTDVVTIRPDVKLETVIRYLRRRGSLPEHTSGFFIIDREGRYLGKLTIEALVTHNDEELVEDVMQPDSHCLEATTTVHEVAQMFERYSLISAAVVDQGKLLGRITIDDVLDIIRDKADHALMRGVGLDESEDLFAPVSFSAKKRTIWLAINLVTAFLAAWVIGIFETTIDKIVALAILMPIVASMGGIAGSQTLTITIRGLSLNLITGPNIFWLARKEFAIGVINGFIWAIVIALLAWGWFGDIGIGLVIGTAIIINLIVAAISGIAIPLVLNRLGIDPAVSGAVVLTTVTDVVGFMSFLGLASIYLIN
jgi:magnesium transporter